MSNAALSWARAQRGMTLAEKAVLMVLADCYRDGACWPSHQVIADDCCIRRQAVPGIIARLAERGLITSRRTGKQSVYTLAVGEPDITEDVREQDNRSPPTGQPMSAPQTTDVRRADTNPKEPKRTQTNPKTRLAGFAEWWAGYPHKVGKGAAEKAWPKALALARGADLAAAVRRYIDGKPADRPWCNPATWLNQRRWEDQEGGNGLANGGGERRRPTGPPPKLGADIPEPGALPGDASQAAQRGLFGLH